MPLTKTRSLRFPSYASLFDVARTHLLLNRELTGDASIDGPAIVLQFDATTLVPPGWHARMHESGVLLLRRR